MKTHELRERLVLHPDPANSVSGDIRSVDLSNDPSMFVVTVRVSGTGRLGLSVDDAAPVYYDLNVRSLWKVPVAGTSRTADGIWRMAVGSYILEPGDTIRPSGDLCGYQVLNISRRCVWFAAFYGDEIRDGLPELNWPDIGGVRVSLTDSRTPERVELRPRVFIRPGDSIRFKRTGARMTVDRLWSNAVHFRYQPASAEEIIDLLCVIVR